MGGKLDGQDSPIFQPNGSSLRVHELGGRINTLYSQAYEFTAAAPFAESTINTWASITGALVTDRVSCTPKTPGRGINQVSGPDVKFEWHQGIQSVQIQLILKKQKKMLALGSDICVQIFDGAVSVDQVWRTCYCVALWRRSVGEEQRSILFW